MRFAFKDASDIWLYNKLTGEPVLYTEDANTFTFKYSSESVYAKAKGNKAVAFDGEATCDLAVEFEVIQFAHLSIMLASNVVKEEMSKIGRKAKGVLGDNKIFIIKNATLIEGSVMLFKLDKDGQSIGDKITDMTAVQEGANIKITVTAEGAKKGDSVIAFYMASLPQANTITMSDKNKGSNYRLEADVLGRTTDGENMVLHLAIHNIKPKKEIEFGLETANPTKFTVNFDVFPDENGDWFKLTFIGDTGMATTQELLNRLDPTAKLKENKTA